MAIVFNKWLFVFLAVSGLYSEGHVNDRKHLFSNRVTGGFHPLHISVTEINHNATEKIIEISCKMFTDDFEKVLAQNYKTKVDLINPADRPAIEKLVNDFVQKHLILKADGKPVQLSYLGYDRDNEATYSYFQAESVSNLKKVEIINTILHELFTDQINMMHIVVNGKRKSLKLDFPEKEAVVSF